MISSRWIRRITVSLLHSTTESETIHDNRIYPCGAWPGEVWDHRWWRTILWWDSRSSRSMGNREDTRGLSPESCRSTWWMDHYSLEKGSSYTKIGRLYNRRYEGTGFKCQSISSSLKMGWPREKTPLFWLWRPLFRGETSIHDERHSCSHTSQSASESDWSGSPCQNSPTGWNSAWRMNQKRLSASSSSRIRINPAPRLSRFGGGPEGDSPPPHEDMPVQLNVEPIPGAVKQINNSRASAPHHNTTKTKHDAQPRPKNTLRRNASKKWEF